MVERRSPKPEVAGSMPVAPAILVVLCMLKGTKIYKFYEQVKQEVLKVVWPSKKELTTSVVIVSLTVLAVSIVLLFLDYTIHAFVQFILNIGK